ncbi:DUF2057 family protein [Shewanella maritima]|uniref:DUF2057 family protein n=1 Tax=Shewanella maritima TaxID=2520507 RepID=UPI003735BB3A
MNLKTSAVVSTVIMALSLTSYQVAAASITTNDNLNIESINGQETGFNNVDGLKSGATLIEINYRDLFQGNADDSGHWVRSESLYLQLDVEASQEYHLQTPIIYTAEQARDFLDDPQLHLTVNGKPSKKVDLLSQSQLLTKLLID